jgi:hypothetical protein
MMKIASANIAEAIFISIQWYAGGWRMPCVYEAMQPAPRSTCVRVSIPAGQNGKYYFYTTRN